MTKMLSRTLRLLGSREGERRASRFRFQGHAHLACMCRTWEAAYAMRLYLTPPSQSSSLVFDPPCLLFGDASTASVLPAVFLAVTPRPPSNATRRTIIEIGSGTGYLSLALAPHLSAEESLILTDLHEVCPLLEKNLTTARNRWKTTGRTVEADVLVRPLPWGDAEALHKLETEGWEADVILASDLVYFPMLYPPLLRTLIGLTGRREGGQTKTKVLFSYKVNQRASLDYSGAHSVSI